jgi:hypothetical protein
VCLELLTMQLVLRRMPTMITDCHKGTPRPIGALLEIKSMSLLVILLRAIRNLSKATAMRCDEGFSVLSCNRRFGLLVF